MKLLHLIFVLTEIADHTAHRRNACSASHNNQFFSLIIFFLESISIRSSHEKAATLFQLKNLACYLAYLTDRQVYIIRSDPAYRNRCFPIFRNGNLEELSRFYITHISHTESILCLGMFNNLLNLRQERNIFVRHLIFPPFLSASADMQYRRYTPDRHSHSGRSLRTYDSRISFYNLIPYVKP